MLVLALRTTSRYSSRSCISFSRESTTRRPRPGASRSSCGHFLAAALMIRRARVMFGARRALLGSVKRPSNSVLIGTESSGSLLVLSLIAGTSGLVVGSIKSQFGLQLSND